MNDVVGIKTIGNIDSEQIDINKLNKRAIDELTNAIENVKTTAIRHGVDLSKKLKDMESKAISDYKILQDKQSAEDKVIGDKEEVPTYYVGDVLFDIVTEYPALKKYRDVSLSPAGDGYKFVKGRLHLKPSIDLTNTPFNILMLLKPNENVGSRDIMILGDATRYSKIKKNDGKCFKIGWVDGGNFVVSFGGDDYSANFPIPRVPCSMLLTVVGKDIYLRTSLMGTKNVTFTYTLDELPKLVEVNRIGIAGGSYYQGIISELSIVKLDKEVE